MYIVDKNRNSKEDRGSPCFTPILLSKNSDNDENLLTHNFVVVYMGFRIFNIFVLTLLFVNLNHNSSLLTKTKAILKSTKAQ